LHLSRWCIQLLPLVQRPSERNVDGEIERDFAPV